MKNLSLIGLIFFFLILQLLHAQSKDIFDHNLDGKVEIQPIKRPNTSSLIPVKKPSQPLLSLKLSNKDYENFDLALSQAKKWRWKSVKLISQKIKNEDAQNILHWIRHYNGADDLTFADYKNFLRDNSHWPLIESIKIKTENKISFSDNHDELINYFKNQKPLTGWGKIYYGNSRLDASKIGFDDDFIYNELNKDLSSRKIQMKQISQKEAKKAFLDWDKKIDKVEY